MIKARHLCLSIGVSALALMLPGMAAAQDVSKTSSEPGVGGAGSADQLGSDAGSTDQSDITVTAYRRSLETAQAIKRDSDQIVDSVVAEDIGKLPDVTGAESLARITGVQVDRGSGEASGVRLRGLPDVATTYNGREIFTAEGRSVALQDFPSASIARIDVYKSASAELVEPGIAGLIDVRSRMPLDFKGTRIAGGVSGVHWSQSQKFGIDANLLVSTRWHTGIGDMGLLIEGSYADIKFLDSSRIDSQTINILYNVPGATGPIRYPSNVNISYGVGERWRPSAHAAFQWRPASNFEIYVDGLFQGFRSRDAGRNLNVNTLASGNYNPASGALSDITYFEGTNLVRGFTVTRGTFPAGAQNAIRGQTDTYQGGAGFIWKPGKGRISGDIAVTDSTYTQNNLGFLFTTTKTQPVRSFNFDTPVGAGGGTATLVDTYNTLDPTNYRFTQLNDNGNRNHGRSVQARLDAEYPVSAFGLEKIQLGLRYTSRDTDARSYNQSKTAPGGLNFTTLPLEYTSNFAGFNGDDATSLTTWLSPTADSIRAHADDLRGIVGLPKGLPAFSAPIYAGNETSYAGYAQGRYRFDLGAISIDGLLGVRVTRTEDQISGITQVSGKSIPASCTASSTTSGTAGLPISCKNDYTDVLPNVSARVKFSNELQLRLAFTKTRTRPGFGSLSPAITLGAQSAICGTDPNSPDCNRPATGGNPDLKPVKSTNYDASLEYYFTRDGSLTIGFFHRDLNGFINNTTTQIVDPTFGRLNYSVPQNGGKGRISGVEAGFRTFFRASWLPKWTRDFGVLLNYTYLDHKSELAPTLAASLPGMQPLTGVSSHLANASLFYENRVVSLRVAYNYRSSFVQGYAQVADPGLAAYKNPNGTFNANPVIPLGPTLPVNEKGRGTLDISGTVNPVENISLTFSVANLLNAPGSNSRPYDAAGDTYPYQTRFLDTVYRLGARFRF